MPRLLYRMLLLCLAAVAGPCFADVAEPVRLGPSFLRLDGPWKYHTGDDPRWAAPGFDDSAWESMDLGAPPDANDGDVGITHYAPGWSSKGHPDYHGYAWYRLRFAVTPPAGETLALLGPWAVDSSYQVYANGTLLGGIGDFSGATPTAHGSHYPRFLELPPDVAKGGPATIAIRVWSGPWVAGPGAGGIHVAPVLGGRAAILAQYRLQWLTIVEGYMVDVVPALLFILMAVMVLCLSPLDRAGPANPWLAAALLFSGIQRGNQTFFFWWQIETIQAFVVLILAFISSCSLGAWMMAWRAWFRLKTPAWLPKALAALTILYGAAQLLARPWLFDATFPHSASMGIRYLIKCLHLAFLLAYGLIVFQGIRRQRREGWYALPAVLAIGTVLFVTELTALGVPGIWFPFGVGVSISEYASAIFVPLLFVLMLRRLWSGGAAHHPTQGSGEDEIHARLREA